MITTLSKFIVFIKKFKTSTEFNRIGITNNSLAEIRFNKIFNSDVKNLNILGGCLFLDTPIVSCL